MIVKCIRNDSKALPFHVNANYRAVDVGGAYEIRDGYGSAIIAPLRGALLEFVPIKK